MDQGASLIGLLLSAFAPMGGCVSENVLLGSNVDAGIAGQDAALAPGAPTPSTLASASDAAFGLCLSNPHFHGSPTTVPGMIPRPPPVLPYWNTCSGNVDVNPAICTLPAPPLSATYIGLPVGYAAFFQHEIVTSVSTQLPAELPPGMYSFSIQLGVAVSTLPRGGFGIVGGAASELLFYGSKSSLCGRDQLLARIPFSNTDSWETYSGMLIATQPFSNLVLVPSLVTPGAAGHAGAYVVVANFLSASCN